VAFPDMSTEENRRSALLRSLGLVGGIGVLGIAATFVLPDLALVFVGGQAYAPISDRLWAFAVLGTVLSMLQLLVYAVLARSGRRPVLLVWAAFAAVVLLGLQATSLTGLLTIVVSCDSALLVALLLTDVRRPRGVGDFADLVQPGTAT
jgi:hypothetical protein